MPTATKDTKSKDSSTKASTSPAVSEAPTPGELDAKTTRKRKVIPAPVTSPAPPGLNDTRADDEPVLGHFVEVDSGKHKGRYGVFYEVEDGDIAVIRDRYTAERVAVPLSSVRRAAPRR